MPTLLRCEIDGVDRSAYLVGIEGLAPAGYGEVGTATLIFKRDATLAYSLQDKQRVEVGLHDGTNWVHREFGGWISDIDIQNTVPAEFLAVGCQDHNLILDVLVSQPLVDLIFPGGVDFDDMVQAVVTAYNGAAAKQIDASSQVANLITSATMPSVTIPGDSSLREALQLVMDAAQVTAPALRPRFFLGNDNTTSSVFGNAVLYVYDGALVPSVSFRFSDNPGIGQKPIYGEFKIKDDGTSTRNRRWLVWREDAAVMGEDTTSKGLYPSPYSPHNAWMGKALTDTEQPDVATAQSTIDGLVNESAYFRRTITFQTVERVRVGMVVGVSWAKEGMVDVGYYVVGVDVDYSDPLEPMRTLTLNAAVLEFGEHAGKGAGGLVIPHTPPTPPVHNAPTPLNADGSYGVYNGGTGRTVVNLNWTHSISPQVVDYLADVTFEGTTRRISTGYVNTYPLSLPPNTPFSVVLWAFNMWGQISPVSSAAQAGTTQRAPEQMIYNGSMELGSDDPNLLGGWALTLGGASTVTRSSAQAYDMTFSARLNRVASANCKMTSRRMTVDYLRTYTLDYYIRGGSAGNFCQVDVLEYGTGDTPALLATKTRTDAVTTLWVHYQMTLTFPLNTTQIEVRFSNIFAGTGDLYVDAVSLVKQAVNSDIAEHTLSPAKMQQTDPAPLLYNPDFAVPSSDDATVADGWTFTAVNGATGVRAVSPQAISGVSVSGNYCFQIDVTTAVGSKGKLESGKVAVVDTTGGGFTTTYGVYPRIIYQALLAFGTYGVYVDYYDVADNLIGTTTVGTGSIVDYSSGNQLVDTAPLVNAAVSYIRLRIEITGDGAHANTVYISGCSLGLAVVTNMIKNLAITGAKVATSAISSTKLAAGAVTAGKIGVGGISAANQFAAGVVDNSAIGAGAVTNTKLGTITDTTKFHFDAMTGPLTFYDDTAVARGSIAVDRTLNFMRIQADPTALTELQLKTNHSVITLHDDSTSSNRYIQYASGTTDAPHKFTGGSVAIHDAVLATGATNAFLYLPYMNGTPSGLPGAITGGAPCVWDDTNKKLYVYSVGASAWKSVTLT